MNSQLSERIRRYSSTFSKGQKQIARYIEEHPDRVAFMTAAKLGLTVGVSESTVVRFATEIGYSGYPALQQAMQEMIRSKLTSLQRLTMSMEQFEKDKILETVLDKDASVIRRTKENLNQEAFYKAVRALVPVKKVYILGAGSSLALATFLSHYCELIFDSVHLIEATGEARIYQQMISADKDDAIIAMSFPRYSKKAVKALDFAEELGAVTIAITDTESSPLAKHASHVLLAKSEMVSFVDSLVGPLSLINALIVALSMEKHAAISETLNRIEHIWDEYGVYEKVDEGTDDEKGV